MTNTHCQEPRFYYCRELGSLVYSVGLEHFGLSSLLRWPCTVDEKDRRDQIDPCPDGLPLNHPYGAPRWTELTRTRRMFTVLGAISTGCGVRLESLRGLHRWSDGAVTASPGRETEIERSTEGILDSFRRATMSQWAEALAAYFLRRGRALHCQRVKTGGQVGYLGRGDQTWADGFRRPWEGRGSHAGNLGREVKTGTKYLITLRSQHEHLNWIWNPSHHQ